MRKEGTPMELSPVTGGAKKVNHSHMNKKVSRLTLPHSEAMASNTFSNSSWFKNRAEVLRGIRAGVKSGKFESCSRMFSMHIVRACAKLWSDRPSVLELISGEVSIYDSSNLSNDIPAT
jgi:hypothetical protein